MWLLQGFSRFDAMIRLTRSIRYTHLRSCGHLTFVGAPLETDLALVGCPLLTLWVESSDSDADIFAYLEDQDPETGKARCAAGLPLLAPAILRRRLTRAGFTMLCLLGPIPAYWSICKTDPNALDWPAASLRMTRYPCLVCAMTVRG